MANGSGRAIRNSRGCGMTALASSSTPAPATATAHRTSGRSSCWSAVWPWPRPRRTRPRRTRLWGARMPGTATATSRGMRDSARSRRMRPAAATRRPRCTPICWSSRRSIGGTSTPSLTNAPSASSPNAARPRRRGAAMTSLVRGSPCSSRCCGPIWRSQTRWSRRSSPRRIRSRAPICYSGSPWCRCSGARSGSPSRPTAGSMHSWHAAPRST